MYTVYKITNLVNNKIYIGCTKQPLSVRFSGSYNSRLKSDLALYGKKNFVIEPIFKTDNAITARIAETNNIMLYDSANPEIGYNIDRKSDYPDMAEYARTWTPKQEAYIYVIDAVEKKILDDALEEFRGSLRQEDALVKQCRKDCEKDIKRLGKTFAGIGISPEMFLSEIGYRQPKEPIQDEGKVYALGDDEETTPPINERYYDYLVQYPWLSEQAYRVLKKRHAGELFPKYTEQEWELAIKEQIELAGLSTTK